MGLNHWMALFTAPRASQPNPDCMRTLRLLPLLLLCLVVGTLAIDRRALWTDEIGTWSLTVAAGLSDWAERFLRHTNSDGQLPLYHLVMYLWTQVFGSSELALRTANLPWFAIALVGLSRLRLAQPIVALTLGVFCLHALVWYQLNDARPYLLHLAGACWLLAGCVNLVIAAEDADSVDQSWRELLLGTFLLVGGSILGAFWILGASIALALCYPRQLIRLLPSIARQPVLSALLLLATLLVLGVAVYSHLNGARASQAASFSIAGMVYGVMELLGISGLGPSRHALRGQLAQADWLQMALLLMAALLAASALVFCWWRLPPTRERLALALACLLPLLMLAALGILLHWRVVGRHLSAALPLICLGMGLFLYQSVQHAGRWHRITAGLLVIALLASTASIRWAPRHGKDDYRQAAIWAKEALKRGERVLWIADERALAYYGLGQPGEQALDTVPPGLIPFSRFQALQADALSLPQTVILSPREGVDPGGLARPVLATGRYKLEAQAIAFELYRLR